MKRLFALLLLSVLSVHAADTTPATAPDPVRLKLAREVIEATQVSKMLDGISTQMQQILAQQLESNTKDLPEEKRANLENAQKEIVELFMEQTKWMFNKMDTIYAEVFTEKELLAIKNFYESAEGRSMIEKQPQLMQHMMPLAMEMQQNLAPKMEAIMEKYELTPKEHSK